MGLSLTILSEMYVSKCDTDLVDKLQSKGPWKDAMRIISNSAETQPSLELCRGLDKSFIHVQKGSDKMDTLMISLQTKQPGPLFPISYVFKVCMPEARNT